LATVLPPQAARAQASEATQSNCAQLILWCVHCVDIF
jgi:hypothetical protein